MSSDYDVVVVGARAAGAATAMLLARSGHTVLMIDRAPAGADTISTHTLLRTAILQLDRWELLEKVVDADTPPIRKVTLGFGSRLAPIELSDDYGVEALYAPRRTVLDPILTAAAVEAGTEYLDQTTAQELIRSPSGRVIGLAIDTGGGRVPVQSKFLVGADGWRSRIGRLASSRTYRKEAGNSVTMYAYYRGIDVDGVHFQFTPGVSAGLIPTNDGLVCVYLGLPGRTAKRLGKHPEPVFSHHVSTSHPSLARAMRGAKREGAFRRMTVPGFLRSPWGPGWALVGDSGFSKDPISAHGISDAFRDAELCARAIDQVLRGDADEGKVMAQYQSLRDLVAVPMLKHTSELASYGWDEERSSDLMRRISETIKEECRMIVDLPPWSTISRSLPVSP